MMTAAEIKQVFYLAALDDAQLHNRPTVAIDERAFYEVLGPLMGYLEQENYNEQWA